jgi:translation initiation factor 2 subunit 2
MVQTQEDYEKLLEKALKDIKPVESKIDRFEVPQAEGRIEGSKTIVSNFKQICSYIRREPNHVLKMLLGGLATSGSLKGDRLVMTRKIMSREINEKISNYVNEFVICKECKKPDTELRKEDKFLFMYCMACGAKKSVRQ